MTFTNLHTTNFRLLIQKAVLLLGCLLPMMLSAQTWERFYDFSEKDYYKSALITEDGGIMFIGHYDYLQPNGFSTSDIALMKTDRNGNLVWEKSYTLNSYEEISRAISTSDGNFIGVGLTFDAGNGHGDGWIVKIDQQGEVLWERKYGGSDFDRISGIVETADGGFAFCGSTRSPISGDIVEAPLDTIGAKDSWVGKIDAAGNLLWNHRFGSTEEDVLKDVIEAPNGDIISTGNYLLPLAQGGHWEISLYRHDSEGAFINEQLHGGAEFEEVFSIINTTDGGFALGAITNSQGNGDADTYLLKLNADGEEEWDQTYGGTLGEFAAYIMQMEDGGYTVLSSSKSFGSPLLDLYLIRTDENGEEQWSRVFDGGENRFDVPYPFSVDEDGNYFIVANTQEKDVNEEDILSSQTFIIKADPLGNSTTNAISGRLAIDQGNNCIPEAGEPGLEDWLVVARGVSESFYATSDETGNYLIELPVGDYAVRVIAPGAYWEACDEVAFISIDAPYDTTTYDFNFNDQSIICADLEIDISTPFLDYCDENTYHLIYRNNGTVNSSGGFVEIELPPSITLTGSSIGLSTQSGNIYGFAIADLAVNSIGSFEITVDHDCTNEQVGRTYQIEARISPDEICTPNDPIWDGASLALKATVVGETVQFEISNIGTGDMGNAMTGIIIEDWVLPRTEPIQLNSTEMDTITVTPEGKTVRLQIEQTPGHPGRSHPSITVEGVGTNVGGGITLGYVNHYPEDDRDYFKSMDAQISYGNFLPNVLRAYPRGYDVERLIAPNEDIEYHLRFQHTGSDTLDWLYVQSELPPQLDVESLRPGASSHPYDYEVVGNGIVRFNFSNLNLVGDEIDEAASYGFIKFRVSQQRDLPNGTAFFTQISLQKPNSREYTNEVYHQIRHGYRYGAFVATHCEGDTVFGQPVTEDMVVLRDTTSLERVDSITTARIMVLNNSYRTMNVAINYGELYNEILYLEDTTLIDRYLAFNGCDSIVMTNLDILTGTNDIDNNKFHFSLFPNPGNEQVTVTYRLPVSTRVTINLYNRTGKLYQNIVSDERQLAGERAITLPGHLPSGLYWVEMMTEQGNAMEKLVILK